MDFHELILYSVQLLSVLSAVFKSGECSVSSLASGVSFLFEYETDRLLEDNDEGIIAAFGDFNADELCDVFVITNSSRSIDILLAVESHAYNRKRIITVDNSLITSVVPGDYNGDVQMDVLVVTRPTDSEEGPFKYFVFWGNHTTKSVDPVPYEIKSTFLDEPLVFDFNADMLPDLLVEDSQGNRTVWLSSTNKTFYMEYFPRAGDEPAARFNKSQSHVFVDLNSDLTADIVFTTEKGYEVWINKHGKFVYNRTYPYPEQLQRGYIGQSSFVDIDQNHLQEHILPGCLDRECTASAIYLFNTTLNKWEEMLSPDHFIADGSVWNFVPPGESEFTSISNQSFLVTLHMVDYNLDGYPDVLAVLRNRTGSAVEQRAFLFDNVPCTSEICGSIQRTFQLQENSVLKNSNKDVVLATFFDIYEDGVPDIVMVAMDRKKDTDPYKPKMIFLKNDVAYDSTFVKVTVVSGLCNRDCPKDYNPYGVNYPGPTVIYSTTKTDNTVQTGIGTQLSQTAHYSLQTPYQVFGLGSTPNFLDHLSAGVPTAHDEEDKNREWPFIIPNSQLIIIPHPPGEPSRWLIKLYVTPSQLVYFTGAALLGTCGFVAGIVGVLAWREKREDKLEKKQDAQKFHFDAM